jgi:predicted transcriptional regulator
MNYNHVLYDRERKEVIKASLLALLSMGDCTVDELIKRSNRRRGHYVLRRYVDDMLKDGTITVSDNGVLHKEQLK